MRIRDVEESKWYREKGEELFRVFYVEDADERQVQLAVFMYNTGIEYFSAFRILLPREEDAAESLHEIRPEDRLKLTDYIFLAKKVKVEI